MKNISNNHFSKLIILIVASLLGGCEDTKTVTNTVIEKGLDSLISQTPLMVGSAECVFGGIIFSSGLDLNEDAFLDDSEVTDSNVVCNVNSKSVLDPALVAIGKDIFRYDTFGDEQFWTDTLKINEVIEAGVSPITALSVGLKLDAEMLPEGILDVVDLNDPATTVALIGLNAVVGIQGTVENIDGVDRLISIGVTCALCHSDVDDSVINGVGKRLDGFPNRDLDPGLIISLSPVLQDAEIQAVLTSWGPGKYDAYWNQDGINDPTVIPPAYGFSGVHNVTFTGEGDISYWNAYVAVTQMGANGNFVDEELGIENIVENDQLTSKLEALKEYQFSLDAPAPPEGSFDPIAAGRGKVIFENKAQCSSCHSGVLLSDANFTLHAPSEVGTDPLLASRSKTGLYRTTPLAGAWQRTPYFHNGSAENLAAVITHYDNHLGLALSIEEQADLEQYLKSL